MIRDAIQELRELGLRGTLFRVGWEVRTRSGIIAREPIAAPSAGRLDSGVVRRLPFAHAAAVADAVRDRIDPSAIARLGAIADDAERGRILCFGRWTADFGAPIDWHLNPVTGARWPAAAPWPRALAAEPQAGDVKLTWEIGRFPHAYHLARAAAFDPPSRERRAATLLAHVEDFVAKNPIGRGVHWASGQEIAFRLMAWTFAHAALLAESGAAERASTLLADALSTGAAHVEAHIEYARLAVYNNHLLSEALLLLLAGSVLERSPETDRWRRRGAELLDEQAERQFYADGGYIQQAHNYHRVALQDLLWACAIEAARGEPVPASWRGALGRSVDFLVAHQCPRDGRLPNYGANDGALPSILSTCDFSDFRPVLQAASLVARGERLYEPGPWDEEAAWMLGPGALDAPVRRPARASVAFVATGHHVLRASDPATFAAFRCGSLRDRFSQIDMLHLDLWWRGLNVLVDPGTYRYNAAPEWHASFVGTASHNTVTVDGRDQMLLYRKFKTLYWTQAALLRFEDAPGFALAAGEHYGYRRHRGACTHRRSVLLAKDDEIAVVVDRVTGEGAHDLRLHWLGGFPEAAPSEPGALRLDTPEGIFSAAVFDASARRVQGSIACGADEPPRGWLARTYGEKVAVPSLAVELRAALPFLFVTVLGAGDVALSVTGGVFQATAAGRRALRFRIEEGIALFA